MLDICIYHGIDLDGWCSAAIIKDLYPACEMIPFDYGTALPKLPKGNIIIVDVSLEIDKVRELLNEGRKLVWIDHHISAIKKFDAQLRYDVQDNPNFKFSLNPKKAACELTWEFINPNKPIPKAVHLLGRYDCFGSKGTSEEMAVLVFQYAARAVWTDWQTASAALHLSDEQIDQMHTEGLIIYQSLITDAKLAYKNRYEIELDGHRVAVLNKERFNPINFGIDYHADGYDAFLAYYYDCGKWKFSLYNENGKIDCSEICQRLFQGGGHRGAAGFVLDADKIKSFLK